MYLILKRASASHPSGDWSADDFDVAADGAVVGRIFKVDVSASGPWMWTLISPHHEGRTPTLGYAATREAAMAAFAKSWRRELKESPAVSGLESRLEVQRESCYCDTPSTANLRNVAYFSPILSAA